MSEKQVKQEAAPAAEEIMLEEFLKDAAGSITIKAMFKRHVEVTKGKEKRTKAAFEKAFSDFKEMPADKLK